MLCMQRRLQKRTRIPFKITCFELTTNVIRTIILIMKTSYFGFLVAFITPTVCVASTYNEMIQQCDKAAETELENALIQNMQRTSKK